MSQKVTLTKLAKNELGATMLEYALIASLVAVVAIGGVTKLGDESRKTIRYTSCRMCMEQRVPAYSAKEWYCKVTLNFPTSGSSLPCLGVN